MIDNISFKFFRAYARSIRTVIKILSIPEPILFCGSGSSQEMIACLKQHRYKNVLVVTDEVLLNLSFVKEILKQFDSGPNLAVFSGVVPDPTSDVVMAGVSKASDHKADAILAVGGGSAIDTAKAIAACVSNDKDVADLFGLFKVKKQPLPLYVIPTTSGTGSETTLASVISDPDNHKKHLIVDPKLVPKMAALDGHLMKALPANITAATGMDALSHAIEAYISCNSSTQSDENALIAARLIFNNLTLAYSKGEDESIRQNMALGSYYAGMAINEAGLGYVHAIAHNLGAKFGTPHGIANAIVLPKVLKFSFDRIVDKLAHMSRVSELASIDADDEQAARLLIKRVCTMNAEFGIPKVVEAMRMKDIPELAKLALKEAHYTPYAVPKYMRQDVCEQIIKEIAPGQS